MIDVEAGEVEGRRWTPARLAKWAYLAATAVGVLMRFQLAGVPIPGRFDHLLHAHSHTLYFGWGALGLLAAAGVGRVGSGWAALLAGLLLIPLGVGFLVVGYAPITIGISTILMIVWYVVAWRWWKHTAPTSAAGLAIRGGIAYLVGSTIGIWFLAVAQALDLGRIAEQLGVHGFLSGFGWFFVMGVTGVVLTDPSRFGLAVDVERARRVLMGWMALGWLVFPLAVPGGMSVPVLGWLARSAGVLLVVPTLVWAQLLWCHVQSGPFRAIIRWSAAWLTIGVSALGAVAIGGDDVLAMAGRQGVVVHLHALFVGYVTPLLALALASTPTRALLVHHLALAAMLGGLTLVMGGVVSLGMWVAAVAAGGLWLAASRWGSSIGRVR
ncbi:MAG: hypothetical protein ACLGHX_06520 [Acidimicrobiia bacterium]